MKERNYYVRRSVLIAPIQQSRRAYMAPQVLSVIPHEPVMAGIGSKLNGTLEDTKPGIGYDSAKEQNFFLPDDSDEDSWE